MYEPSTAPALAALVLKGDTGLATELVQATEPDDVGRLLFDLTLAAGQAAYWASEHALMMQATPSMEDLARMFEAMASRWAVNGPPGFTVTGD